MIDQERAAVEGALRGVFSNFMSWSSDVAILEEAEPPKFRGSKIPHCPIEMAIDLVSEHPRVEARGFMLDYVSEHGRLVHEMLQKWLGIVGLMYGRWKCPVCGAELPEQSSGLVGLQGPVRHCNVPCSYVEYDIDDKSIGYTGHCDGLLVVRKKLLPIEMKVRNADVVAKVQASGPYSVDNICQATSYRRCLPQQLRLPQSEFHDFVGLFYFDRADIRNRALVTYPYTPEVFEAEIQAQKRTRRIVDLGVFNRLRGRGLCRTSHDRPFCPYRNVCFSKNPDALLEKYLPGYLKPILHEDIQNGRNKV